MDKRFQKIRPMLVKDELLGREPTLFDIICEYYDNLLSDKKKAKEIAYKYIKAWVKEECKLKLKKIDYKHKEMSNEEKWQIEKEKIEWLGRLGRGK